MNVKITSTRRGSFSTFVAFTADGVNHTALIYPQERAVDSKVFALGKQGDSCTTTHEIRAPELLSAVSALIQQDCQNFS